MKNKNKKIEVLSKGKRMISLDICNTKIYFASRANATIPAAKGAAADVPV